MAKYKLFFTETFYKALKIVPAKDIKRILSRVKRLADDPRPEGSQKLSGQPDRYRIRQGNYRIIYSVKDEQLVVIVVKVGHRREIYKR
ncbi:MAG: type II toxin-antitoxin system RelE family toxin [Candidatus Binatia bacterium]